jgi:hypothetical protein
MRTTAFNDMQIELLNTMAYLNTEEDLVELKEALSKFFAARASRELDKLWDEGKLNQGVLDNLRHQHLRTPYTK